MGRVQEAGVVPQGSEAGVVPQGSGGRGSAAGFRVQELPRSTVIPAKAGIHFPRPNMDSRFRGNDGGKDPRLRGDDSFVGSF
jgi:hypothetical protein